MRNKKTLSTIVAMLLLISVACFLAYIVGKKNGLSQDAAAEELYAQTQKYPLLAKRTLIDNPNDSFVNFAGLRAQLNDYFTKNNLQGSLYFEYLPTGTSIRIDGDTPEVGASLLKVPAAMELYKANELGRIDIDKSVTLKQEWLDSAFGDLYKKGAGYTLTLRDATKIMLENSDNTALNAVSYSTDGLLKSDENPVSSLDVDISVDSNLSILVSARSYSSFIKCLYFGCYLNNEHSQELLNYLSNTQYTSRIPAGINDKSIVIAHKVGNFAQDTQSDCGIVYLPNRNYVLCAMIKGPDNSESDAKIADLSRMAYDFVRSKQ